MLNTHGSHFLHQKKYPDRLFLSTAIYHSVLLSYLSPLHLIFFTFLRVQCNLRAHHGGGSSLSAWGLDKPMLDSELKHCLVGISYPTNERKVVCSFSRHTQRSVHLRTLFSARQ